MTTFPTGSGSLSRTYFRPRWKETCGGHRTSRVVHGSLRDLSRQSFPDTEINLNSFSYQSPIAPEAPNHVGVGVSSTARPFGRKFAWKSSWDARDYLDDGKEEQCLRLNRPSRRAVDILISVWIGHRTNFLPFGKTVAKRDRLKNIFVSQNNDFTILHSFWRLENIRKFKIRPWRSRQNLWMQNMNANYIVTENI